MTTRQLFRRLRCALGCIGLVAVAGLSLAQVAPAPTESAVKAAFLLKFASFVEWPAGALARPEHPLVIGVSGDDEVAADLEQLAAGRKVDGHPVVVKRLPEGSPAAGSHIVFLGGRRDSKLREAIDALTGPVLVVTEQTDGLRLGAVINFMVAGGRVRFTASLASADARNLKLSARLLAVAQAVEGRSR